MPVYLCQRPHLFCVCVCACQDNPPSLCGDLYLVLAALALARHEVMWYMWHVGEDLPTRILIMGE